MQVFRMHMPVIEQANTTTGIEPSAAPIEVVGEAGQHVADLGLTSRESILVHATVLGAEGWLAARFGRQSVGSAEHEWRCVLGAAINCSCSASGHAALQTDPYEAAVHYVLAARGKQPNRPALPSFAGEPDALDGQADDAVAIPMDELFGDDDDEEDVDEVARLGLSAGDLAEIEANERWSSDGRQELEADLQVAESTAISAGAAEMAVRALHRRAVAMPRSDPLRSELRDLEHKMADALPHGRPRLRLPSFRIPGYAGWLAAGAAIIRLNR